MMTRESLLAVTAFFKGAVTFCVRVTKIHPVKGESSKFRARCFSRGSGRFHILGFYEGDLLTGKVERLGFYDDERGMTEDEVHDRSIKVKASRT